MKKLIVVCSKNKAKNDAVKSVMEQFLDEFDIKSLETDSGVFETPISDDGGIKGCFNRINDAINQEDNGHLYVAMEGILSTNEYGSFICGWTVIYNKVDNEYYYGCSSKVRVDDEIMAEVDSSKRLSDVVAKFVDSTGEEISNFGTNGILTYGAYTRTDEFRDSVLCAISTKYKRI